jgi:hypothetical protein
LYGRWYAPPSEPQDDDNEEDDEEEEGGELEENSGEIEQVIGPDSAPIDYNTFVPSYDPTLGVAQTSIGHPQLPAATNDLTKLTKDEIFEKAVSASYWAGYWTAMYHVRLFPSRPSLVPNCGNPGPQ